MQALCGLQGIFDLFNCKTPEFLLLLCGQPVWPARKIHDHNTAIFR